MVNIALVYLSKLISMLSRLTNAVLKTSDLSKHVFRFINK